MKKGVERQNTNLVSAGTSSRILVLKKNKLKNPRHLKLQIGESGCFSSKIMPQSSKFCDKSSELLLTSKMKNRT